MDRKKTAAYIGFAVIMIALGASDALKGVFAPIFETHFALTNTQLSAVITVGYIGNLMFLISGGGLADRYKIKTVFLAALLAWMGALMLYLVTDNYYCLLIGVFVTMGTSTFMNTMINLMSPLIFTGASAIAVNTLFFVQGIGTAGSQKLAGMYAGGFGSWKLVNGLLLALGLLGLVFVVLIRVPEPKSAAGGKGGEEGQRGLLRQRRQRQRRQHRRPQLQRRQLQRHQRHQQDRPHCKESGFSLSRSDSGLLLYRGTRNSQLVRHVWYQGIRLNRRTGVHLFVRIFWRNHGGAADLRSPGPEGRHQAEYHGIWRDRHSSLFCRYHIRKKHHLAAGGGRNLFLYPVSHADHHASVLLWTGCHIQCQRLHYQLSHCI